MLNELDVLMSGHQFKKLYEKKYEFIMKKYELKKIEIEILNFISNCGENDTARDIAKVQYISKAHISNTIDELKHKKYINVVEDCQDRRYVHLCLTNEARPIIEEIEEIKAQIFAILFRNVAEEEKQLLYKIAKQIVSNISEELE